MRKLRITIDNKSYEVTVEDLTEEVPYTTPVAPAPPSHTPPSPAPAAAVQPAQNVAPPKPDLPIDVGAVTSPMAGVITSILVKQGDRVDQGQSLCVLDAMKMENQITAPVVGTVKSVNVAVGDSVKETQVLLVLE